MRRTAALSREERRIGIVADFAFADARRSVRHPNRNFGVHGNLLGPAVEVCFHAGRRVGRKLGLWRAAVYACRRIAALGSLSAVLAHGICRLALASAAAAVARSHFPSALAAGSVRHPIYCSAAAWPLLLLVAGSLATPIFVGYAYSFDILKFSVVAFLPSVSLREQV